jgi:hypothetical protein
MTIVLDATLLSPIIQNIMIATRHERVVVSECINRNDFSLNAIFEGLNYEITAVVY